MITCNTISMTFIETRAMSSGGKFSSDDGCSPDSYPSMLSHHHLGGLPSGLSLFNILKLNASFNKAFLTLPITK